MPTPDERISGSGLAYAIGAYGIWGFMPVFFATLAPAGSWEIVAARIVFSLVFCLILITVTRAFSRLRALLRRPRTVAVLAVAGFLVAGNWLIYVFAALNGRVLEASLGYFINPIVTVLLGVVVLRERLRPMQWAAIGISAVAVIVIVVGYGELPWVSLGLAATFGVYGLLKKRVGGSVDAVSGLTVETLALSPFALAFLVWLSVQGTLVLGTQGTVHTLLMAASGVITAVPLLLFAAGSRRLPLTIMGVTQYVAPILQLIVGLFISGEHMSTERWLGFGIVWLALIVLTVDMFVHGSRRRGAVVPQTP